MTDVSRVRVLAGAGAALLAVLVLTSLGSPVVVRALLCLPVLVGMSGVALSNTLVPRQARLDGLTRVGLALVFGLGVLLCSALLLTVAGGGLAAERLVVVLLLVTAVTLVVWYRWGGPAPAIGVGRALSPPSTVLAMAGGVVVLVLAVVVGRLLLPGSPDSPTFSFTGPAATAAGPMSLAAGDPIRLGWAVRHAGSLPPGQTMQAVVDGRPAAVSFDIQRMTGGSYSGQVEIAGPTDPGVHRVVLAMPLPSQRLELVAYVNVHRP
jgi:hypothetical protein